MKKVSIIMPVYNVEKYLCKSLDSLINQTLDDYEVIIINDGSTDNSEKIILSYKEKYPHLIKYVSTENHGAAHARNIGLSLAEGEYIGFVDSDDYANRTMFQKLYELAKKSDSEITTCGYFRVDYDDVRQRDAVPRECFGKSVYQSPKLLENNVPYIWNKLYKKSLIDRENMRFEENLRIYEDLVFNFKLFLCANKVDRVCEALYTYIYSRTNSLTFTFSEKRFDLFTAFDSLFDFYKTKKAFQHFEDELLFILINHIYVVCGGNSPIDKIPLKYKFINQSFQYLYDNFPYWKTYTTYYRKYKKNKYLFTKKIYWKINSLMPRSLNKITNNFTGYIKGADFNRRGSDYYKCIKKNKVRSNRVLLDPQHGANLSGNMFYLLKELCTNPDYKNMDIGLSYSTNKTKDKFEKMLEEYNLSGPQIHFVKNNSKQFVLYLATSKYLFNDTSFPVYFMKRKEQIYLNTWHGTPLKTLGRSTEQDYYDIANLQKNFMSADYLLYPSEYMIDSMLEDYMLDGNANNKILKCGYPRNEIFFDKLRENEVRKKYSLEDKQVIAYMPTWRGNVRNVQGEQRDELLNYLDYIDKHLTDNQFFYVNLHPFVENKVNYQSYTHIYQFPEELETYDFLNACDILITDYSSVFFDYAVTEKKIILFAYDEEDYFKERGVYMPFSDLPFTKVDNVESLIKEINDTHSVPYKEFIQTYCHYEDEAISKKICSLVIKEDVSNLHIIDLPKQKKNMLIFADNFSDNEMIQCIKTLSNEYKGNKDIYLNYETKELRDRLILKEIPRKIRYMGTLNHYSSNSLFESFLLKFTNNSLICSLLYSKISKILDKEKYRAYPNSSFIQSTVISKTNPKTMLFATRFKKSVLYIRNIKDYDDSYVHSIYAKFTSVIFENDVVAKECNYTGDNKVIKSIRSFEDLKI